MFTVHVPLLQRKNEMNAEWIKKNLPFKAENIEKRLPKELSDITGHMGYIQVLPYMAHTDGFFVAKFKRKDLQEAVKGV